MKETSLRRYCGIFPWIYVPHPVHLNKIVFKELSADKPTGKTERKERYLSKIVSMFRQGNGSPISSAVYFFTQYPQRDVENAEREIREDVMVFSYLILRAPPLPFYRGLERVSSYCFELGGWRAWLSGEEFGAVDINGYPSQVSADHVFVPNNPEVVTEQVNIAEDRLTTALVSLAKGELEGVSSEERERVIRAISWCLESCRSYSFNCPESNIVALGTAFEVLFDITGFERKVEALRVAIITLLGDDDAATMRKWVTKFYEERSRAVHLGWALDSTWPPPRRVKRPYGPSGWYQVSAWKVFDACLEAMLTNRNTGNARFIEGLSEFVKSLP